jgi:hypothetical protein
MKTKIILPAVFAFTLASGQLMAAVSTDEAAKLGNALTPVGAEKAGNAAGTIPAWDGGIELVSEDPVFMTDPFKGEKPIYSITAANVEEYKQYLSAGSQELFASNPDYRMDVYTTKRTAVAPQWIYDNTKTNATNTTLKDGLALVNWQPGIPFPIPQDGDEAVWNHLVRWVGQNNESVNESYYVDSTGKPVKASTQFVSWISPSFSPDVDWGDGEPEYLLFRADFKEPARRAGEITLVRDPIDFSAGNGRKAWQYLAGQRRVRRAPSVAFDTPAPETSGTSTYDDTYMYNGSPERYDWTLVGKQECIVPYNNWRAINISDVTELLGPKNINPDLMRWELHRCWVVEGVVKEGERHIYNTRRFYIDEDTWSILMADLYDARGELWRSNFSLFALSYQAKTFWSQATFMYDFQAKMYNINGASKAGTSTQMRPPKEPKYYTSSALKRSGVR